MENGELPRLSVEAGYDVMVMADQGIEHQNNMAAYRIALVTLMSSRWPDVEKHVPEIKSALQRAKRGRAVTVEIPSD